jgi:hypothetical protein
MIAVILPGEWRETRKHIEAPCRKRQVDESWYACGGSFYRIVTTILADQQDLKAKRLRQNLFRLGVAWDIAFTVVLLAKTQ